MTRHSHSPALYLALAVLLLMVAVLLSSCVLLTGDPLNMLDLPGNAMLSPLGIAR